MRSVAVEDGHWRWKDNTHSTTAAEVAVGDYVDVRQHLRAVRADNDQDL